MKRIAVSTLNYFGGRDEVKRTPNSSSSSSNNMAKGAAQGKEDEAAAKEREKRKRKIETSEERNVKLKKMKWRKRESHHHRHHRHHHHEHHHGRGHTENRHAPRTPLATRARETTLRQLPRAYEANARTQDSGTHRQNSKELCEEASGKRNIGRNNEISSAHSGGKSVLLKDKRSLGGERKEAPGRPYTFDDMVAEAGRKREGQASESSDGGSNKVEQKVKREAPIRPLQEGKEASKNDSHNGHSGLGRRPLPPLPDLYPLLPEGKGSSEREGKTKRLEKGKCGVSRSREKTVVKHSKVTPRESDFPGESVRVKVEPKEGDGEEQHTPEDSCLPVILSGGGSVAVVTAPGGIPAVPLAAAPLATTPAAAPAIPSAQIAPPYTIRLSLAGLPHVKPTIVIISTGKGKHVQVLLISAGITIYCN